MSTFQPEEKKRTTTYDIKIIKWLLSYIRPNKSFFILSLILMILTAALEVLIPYLTKDAIDNYIYPSWIMSDKTIKEINLLTSKYPDDFIELENDYYLIDISKIDDVDRTNLEKNKSLLGRRYIVFDESKIHSEKKSQLLNIFKENKDIFYNYGKIYYARFSDLESLNRKEIQLLRSESHKSLKKYFLFIFTSLIGVFLCTSAFTYILFYSGHRIMHRIRYDAFSHILKLPQIFFDRNPVGRLTTRVTNDINAINEMYTSVLVQFTKDLLVIISIIAIMFTMNKNLTFIILGLTLCLGIVAALFRMRLKTVFRNIRITIGKLNAFVQESVQGIILIKLYGKEHENFQRFKNTNRENYLANMSQLWTYVMFRPFIEYVSILGVGLTLWYGGLNVIRFDLTIGGLIAFLYYVRMLFRPIQELSERYNIFQSAVAASENLYDLINEPIEKNGHKTLTTSIKTIEFKNVWFAYNDEDWVLKDVSFKVSSGETVALVGLTGSGKTTIVNLILKFYEVQRGKILLNGININEIDNNSLRSNITVVFQDLFLFGKDISDESINYKKMKSAFGLNKEIDITSLISSGEKQIVSLAKALDKESNFLIMDEATSHIDAGIERNIQKSIKDYGKKTKLIIAHRLSNVRGANNIIVIHKGKIVETGTHHDLLENVGIYSTLNKFQKAPN